MTVQAQSLTPAQQRASRPRRIVAKGDFDVRINLSPILFQTTTVVHDFDLAVYRINGRHADNSVVVKEIFIQVPDTIRTGQVFKLEEQQSTDLKVWYAVKAPPDHYTVSGIVGTLVIEELFAGVIRIKGALHAVTDKDIYGKAHVLDVTFDLIS